MKDNFTEQQREIIARKMGFEGPMQNFDEFLMSSPATATKYAAVATKLGDKAQAFAKGGVVATKPASAILQEYITATGGDAKVVMGAMTALLKNGGAVLLREKNSLLFIDKHLPRIVATILATQETGETLNASLEVLINKVRQSGITMAYGIEENEELKQAYAARGFNVIASDVPEYEWRVLIK